MTKDVDSIKIDEFSSLKNNNIVLIKFLQRVGLLPKSIICCQVACHNITSNNSKIDNYCFRCLTCRKFHSIRKGTFFKNSKLSLYQILMLSVYYSEGLSNQELLKKQFDIKSNSTIVDWKSFIRDVFINHQILHSNMIGGPGVVVQIDESLMCKRKYGVGRILINQDLWIVGGIDDQGNMFMEITNRRTKSILRDIISRNVVPGSIVVTDGWKGYNGIEDDYLRQIVVHDNSFVNAEGYHTNRIEATWGACKRLFRHVTNKKRELVFSYLCEYMFRHQFKGIILSRLFYTISLIYPLS